MDYAVWVYICIPDIQYGIQAVRKVWDIYILDPMLQNSNDSNKG